jgi:hypothetical protein
MAGAAQALAVFDLSHAGKTGAACPAKAPAVSARLVAVQQLAPRAQLAASARALLIKALLLAQKLWSDRAKCALIPPERGQRRRPPRSPAPDKFILMVANA